ncbi:hypothetical protein JCM15415_21110 [Methanobacterium movens]
MAYNNNKVMVSARCDPKAKMILKNSKYTYGDAINYFARLITHRKDDIRAEIQILKSELRYCDNQIKRFQYLQKSQNEFLQSLEEELLTGNKSTLLDLDLKKPRKEVEKSILDRGKKKLDLYLQEAINAIIEIARKHECCPLEVGKYTKKDLIHLHAHKCGISRLEFEKMIMEQDP